MLSFHDSSPRPLYYSSPMYSVYPDDDSLYRPYLSSPSSRSLVADPEVRYRRALSEYFAAEEEYNAVLRAREEARIRAHAEGLRQERARLLGAQIARARQEQQARYLEQALAKVLSRVEVPEGDHAQISLRDVVPVMCGTSKRSLSDTVVPRLRAQQSQKEYLVSSCDCAPRSSEQKAQPNNGSEANANVPSFRHSPSQPDEHAAPNLESLLRSRLQKVVGDEEVQDVARAILRRLTPTTGGSRPPAPASSPEINASTQSSEGADLSRCDALQGLAAEAAKESFKAHRAEAAKSDEPTPSHTSKAAPSPLTIIQDIRSALEKLSSDFSLPSSLDFSDDEPDGLAYTPTNAPLRIYEHALDGLLEQLDAVESDGDEEVRVERRAVVKEVEKAIEEVERRVREAREGAKRDSHIGGETVSAETTDNVGQVAQTESSVDNEKPEADKLPWTSPDDRLDPASSHLEAYTLPNSGVSLPITAADSESVAGEDVKDQASTTLALESVSQAAEDFAPTLAPTHEAEPSQVSTDHAPESKHDAFPEQATSNKTPATPSSTPVSPTLSSSEISEDDLVSLSHEQFFTPLEREGGDADDDADDEREWIDIEA